MKRLFKELNGVIIIVLTLCNWAVKSPRPLTPAAPITGLISQALIATCFVFMDAVILKSRYLLIGTGFLFVSLNCYHLYRLTLGDTSTGVVLVEYTVYGKDYTIMRRSTQRSIFLQVLLFSLKGIYIMILDKPMKLMVFATANIYKSTGKASEEIHPSGSSSIDEGRRQSQMILGQEALIHPNSMASYGYSGDFLYLGYFQHCVILLVGVVGVLVPRVHNRCAFICCAVTGMLFLLLYKNISFRIIKII